VHDAVARYGRIVARAERGPDGARGERPSGDEPDQTVRRHPTARDPHYRLV